MADIKQNLGRIEAQIAESGALIEKQCALVADVAQRSNRVTFADELLKQLMEARAKLIALREQLSAELSAERKPPCLTSSDYPRR